MLMMLPVPCPCMARTWCFMLRITPSTFVSNVAAYVSAVWSVIGPTWPSVPALFTATSRRPNRATVLSTRARTSSSLRTSALMNSASEPRERSSLASALPASSRRPATTTLAPFLANATAAARPMPVSPPVTKTPCVLICDPFNCLPYRQSMESDTSGRGLETEKVLGAFVGRDVASPWGMPWRYGRRYGTKAPSLFHRGRRGGQPDARGGEKTAHGAAFP